MPSRDGELCDPGPAAAAEIVSWRLRRSLTRSAIPAIAITRGDLTIAAQLDYFDFSFVARVA